MKQVLEEKRLRYGGMEEEGRFMLHSNETEYAILSEDGSLSIATHNLAIMISLRSLPKRRHRLLQVAVR